MTTDIHVSVARDLFVPNDVLYLPRPSNGATALAALCFETHANASDARKRKLLRRKCIEAARQRLLIAWPKLTVWLFACHTSWQPKNRISIHRRLWRSLEHSGVVIPSGERIAETGVETSDGVRFFGVVEVPMKEEDRACAILDAEQASFLAASIGGHPPVVDDRLVGAWQKHHHLDARSWAGLADIVCKGGGIVFRPFGFFDDVEIGTDVIFETTNLRQVARDVT